MKEANIRIQRQRKIEGIIHLDGQILPLFSIMTIKMLISPIFARVK
jgi:hypothetical protein